MSPEPTPRRAIRIVSQCATKDDFVAVFHPYLERDALFVATASPEEAGARLHFVMTLAGGEAVLRGAGVVVESHRSKSNFYGRRGMKLRFDELDPESRSALRAVEAGPRRHGSAPPPPGRSPGEMVECLIYEDPGSDSREPLGGGDATGVEPSDPGNLMPITSDDDVTAVAVQAPPAPNGPRNRPAGFVVPRPRSDPAIAVNPGGERVSMAQMAQLDTEQMPELKPEPTPEPVPAPPRLPVIDERTAPARRGKGTPSSTAEAEPDAAMAPPLPREHPHEVAALATMRLPAAEARRPASQPPDRFRHESVPPDYAGGEFTPPPPMTRQPGAPRRPMLPQATITPTEIVSPLALEARTAPAGRRSRGPMASERTDVVRVSYVRTAAVSATLGALLGLAAGYLLWGLDHETPAVVVPDGDDPAAPPPGAQAPKETPTAAPAAVADAGPAAGLDAAPGPLPPRAAPPRPTAAPVKKPSPRRRHR